MTMLTLTNDNRRIITRQRKRRAFRDPNNTQDLSTFTKRRARVDIDINSNFNSDNINNNEFIPIPVEHQSLEC